MLANDKTPADHRAIAAYQHYRSCPRGFGRGKFIDGQRGFQ